MRKLLLAGSVALMLSVPAAHAQDASTQPPVDPSSGTVSDPAAPPGPPADQPAPPPVVQTQANPPGEGVSTTGVPDPQAAGQTVPPAQPVDPSYQGGPYKGALTAPPASAMNKTYPKCTRTLQDNCRNPGGV